jgi:hypothetical protein
MEAADMSADFWRRVVLPRQKTAADMVPPDKLVDISISWSEHYSFGSGHEVKWDEFDGVILRNTSGKKLKDAVIEVTVKNEWNEESAAYYYVNAILVNREYYLYAHPRWLERRAPYSRKIEATCSIWSTGGHETGKIVKGVCPRPDAEAKREVFLKYDNDEIMKRGKDIFKRLQVSK